MRRNFSFFLYRLRTCTIVPPVREFCLRLVTLHRYAGVRIILRKRYNNFGIINAEQFKRRTFIIFIKVFSLLADVFNHSRVFFILYDSEWNTNLFSWIVLSLRD